MHSLGIAVNVIPQRDQMFTFEITFLPASLPSLPDSYRRVRMAVAFPDGGVKTNMAVTYLPGRVLEAGGVLYRPAKGTLAWDVPPRPTIQRPSSNDALAFLTVTSPWRACHSPIGVLRRGVCAPRLPVLQEHLTWCCRAL
jgi:hypothetical protein